MARAAELRFGLSLMPQPAFAAAAFPLLQAGEVDVLEWGFDIRASTEWQPPDWYTQLVAHYAAAGALLGHGVSGSVATVGTDPAFSDWLDALATSVATAPVDSFSEHLGFSRTARWNRMAPLPLRPDADTIRSTVERLARIRDVVEAPVGLENLALALSPTDLDQRGGLMEALLAPLDGFLHLDLHNLWCAAVNFDRDPVALLESYPLERVRRLHVSGGSMNDGFRRDTHDHGVPDEVFALVPEAVSRCPNLRDVILEQLGHTIEPTQFAADFRRLREVTVARTPIEPSPVRPCVPVDGDPSAEAWQGGLITATVDDTPWPHWPADLDPRVRVVIRDLVERWGTLA